MHPKFANVWQMSISYNIPFISGLLQHHYNPAEHEAMYLRTHAKTIDVTLLQGSLDQDLRNSLLFIHALSGCDTTSRPYGIGKISAMNTFADLQMPAKLF